MYVKNFTATRDREEYLHLNGEIARVPRVLGFFFFLRAYQTRSECQTYRARSAACMLLAEETPTETADFTAAPSRAAHLFSRIG